MNKFFILFLGILIVGIPVIVLNFDDVSEEVVVEVDSSEVRVPIMEESSHLSSIDGVEYNSNPPTSGPHFSDWHKDWTFYTEEQPIGGLVHNMEHGGIVLFYSPGIGDDLRKELEEYVDDTFKVIASPRDGLGKDVVLAAWGVYEEFDSFDKLKFDRFYEANLNKAPETVYP